MKKLVLLLAVVFSVSMFSCKNANNTEAAPVEDAVVEEVETVEVVADSAAAVADSAAVVADSAAVAQ